MRRKKAGQSEPARADGRVAPADIQQVEFRLAFRGYNERDVDAFLDRVTEDLSWYLEENQRLRSAPAPSAASGEQAAEVVARAREEAAEILRRAVDEAAAIRAAAGAGTGDARAAVAPFLAREREFLQSLGGLVQGHAEEVKQMVLAIRARADAAEVDAPPAAAAASAPATDAPAAASMPATDAPAEIEGGATAAEIRERLGEPEPEQAPPQASEPERVVVDATEPAYSTEGAPAGEGRERSLRELFWGDD
jgi:DivIVA domain-containing protein